MFYHLYCIDIALTLYMLFLHLYIVIIMMDSNAKYVHLFMVICLLFYNRKKTMAATLRYHFNIVEPGINYQ